MDRPSSMLSFIQNILSRQQSQSRPLSSSSSPPLPSFSPSSTTTTGRKRERSTAFNAPNISTTPILPEQSIDDNTNTNPITSGEPTDEEMTDRELAIAQFLTLPDGPLVKRAKRDDDRNGRLSIIREVEGDERGRGNGQRGFLDNEKGWAGGGKGRDVEKDIEMEDVELTGIERELERGLWTYHGGNSMLR